eukprot:1274351-Prymnesium_polylepis.1
MRVASRWNRMRAFGSSSAVRRRRRKRGEPCRVCGRLSLNARWAVATIDVTAAAPTHWFSTSSESGTFRSAAAATGPVASAL